ncbi:MAG: glycosyltransferase [Myxococcota bacterium]|jgi:glycosyltransferase involved in cell wall biosynthesis|nr:glycosyltransferase [Myxococcota bacterium]
MPNPSADEDAVRPRAPLVSVVIPTFDRPVALARCLEALAQQTMPRDRFEVIVSDDGSPSPVREVTERFASRLTITCLRQGNRGPAAARNAGACRARGRFLAFTDDDCAPDTDWLQEFERAATGHPGLALGGHTRNALERNLCSTASQVLVDYLYGYFNEKLDDVGQGGGREPLFTSNNLFMPVDRFRAVGGFPEDFPDAAAEDRELCARWQHAGFEIRLLESAVVDHHHDLTLSGFMRQHFAYGRGAFRFQRMRRNRGDIPRIEPLRFYRDLVFYPLGRMPMGRSLIVTALLLLSQLANAAGFFWQRRMQA